jgi:hypothetical protein
MSAVETTISYSTESIGVGSELVIKPLQAQNQNQTAVWGLRFPTNFRHQLCIVVHCRAKLQRTPSFRLYKSITYTSFCGYEPSGREFESLRARQLFDLDQAVSASGASCFFFRMNSAGLLRFRAATWSVIRPVQILNPTNIPQHRMRCVWLLAERPGDEPSRLGHAEITHSPAGSTDTP